MWSLGHSQQPFFCVLGHFWHGDDQPNNRVFLEQACSWLAWEGSLLQLLRRYILSSKRCHRPYICHFSPQMYLWAQFFSTWKCGNCGKISPNFSKFPQISQNFSKISQNFSTWQFFLHEYNSWYSWQTWALRRHIILFSFMRYDMYMTITIKKKENQNEEGEESEGGRENEEGFFTIYHQTA